MRVIAFAGQARCGKTTFAKSFQVAAFEAGATPVIRSFAGPLKQAAVDAGYTKTFHPEEYRDFCQTHGAERRAEDPNYWLDQFKVELQQLAASDAAHLADALENDTPYHETIVLIDDLRYENEYELITEIGGQVCLVMRPADQLPERDAEYRGHESENFGNFWAAAEEEDQDSMFSMIFVNDVPSEQAVMDAGVGCFTLTMMEADNLIKPAIALEEDDLGDDWDDDDEDEDFGSAVDELMDLFRKLKDQADINFGLTDEDIDLNTDIDRYNEEDDDDQDN